MSKILLVTIAIFTCAAFIFYKGKGGFLIAGYNTAPKEIKKLYDVKKLNKAYFYFTCLMIVLLTLYLMFGNTFETMFIILTLCAVAYLLFYENKKCRV